MYEIIVFTWDVFSASPCFNKRRTLCKDWCSCSVGFLSLESLREARLHGQLACRWHYHGSILKAEILSLSVFLFACFPPCLLPFACGFFNDGFTAPSADTTLVDACISLGHLNARRNSHSAARMYVILDKLLTHQSLDFPTRKIGRKLITQCCLFR